MNKCGYCGCLCKNSYCDRECYINYNDTKNSIIISEKLNDIIEGTMFSDACFEVNKNHKPGNPRYRFKQSLEKREYVEYIANEFGMPKNVIFGTTFYKDNRRPPAHYTAFRTKTYKEFMPYYQRWYINGKKCIPLDLKITPIFLLHAWLGDGYLCPRKNIKKGRMCPCQRICTEGFLLEDLVNIFIPKLIEVGIESRIHWNINCYNKRKYNQICVAAKSYNRFFDFIGSCPLDCFRHKWVPGTNLTNEQRLIEQEKILRTL